MASRHRKLWIGLLVVVLTPLCVHYGIVLGTRPRPVPVSVSIPEVARPSRELRRAGRSYAVLSKGLLEVRLSGTPEELGAAEVALLRPEMIELEQRFLSKFAVYVPKPWARFLMMDLARLRFHAVDQAMTPERLREISAMAQTFQPDPFESVLPTYQRLLYLNSLYDISLSFEESPLLGCTSFAVHGAAGAGGHALLARNFDFEVDNVFDEKKVVYFVEQPGKLSFASVAWPGLIGVVSGMNSEGVGVVVHGGRAGVLDTSGEPMIHSLRHVLETAHNADEAAEWLMARKPMVSHVVIVVDGRGGAWALERVPGRPTYRYRLGEKTVLTNHLVGPSADDPKNLHVRSSTSTVQRQQRGEQLLSRVNHPVTPSELVGFLRDRRGLNDSELPLGDRRAVGALIAAHGVVMDATARILWVSEAPHLLGRFVRFDLAKRFSAAWDGSEALREVEAVPADALLTDGGYAAWLKAHPGGNAPVAHEH